MKKARVGLIIDNKLNHGIFTTLLKILSINIYEISCLLIQESHFVKRKNIVKSINEFFSRL